ncbi:MAG TPA: hypothetical protein VJ949_06670, partial [Cryomorphaceae bacterium]|nr:hypothetical protein [Cryomorphaceae bacterium]
MPLQKAFFCTLLFCALISCSPDNYETTSDQNISIDRASQPEALNHTIDVSVALPEYSPESKYPERDSLREHILEFYSTRNNCSFWLGSEKPMPRLESLVKTLNDFSENGNMAYSDFEERLKDFIDGAYREEEPDTAYLAETDLKLTEQYAILADNLL